MSNLENTHETQINPQSGDYGIHMSTKNVNFVTFHAIDQANFLQLKFKGILSEKIKGNGQKNKENLK